MTDWRSSCCDRPPRDVRRPVLLGLVALGLVGAVLMAATPLLAQEFSRNIEKVQVYPDRLRIAFTQPYQDTPIVEHQPGGFSLRFSATGSGLERNTFKINDATALIREYRVVQNRFAATLMVTLRDPKLSLQNGLGFQRDGNALVVTLNPAAAGGGGSSDRELLAEAERRLGGQLALPQQPGEESAPQGLGAASTALEENWVVTLVTMLVALAIVLAVLYGAVYVYNRFLSRRLGGSAQGIPIRHLGAFHLGPKQRIVVLDINGEVIACGVTAQQISFLTKLGGAARAAAGGTPARKPAAGPAPGTAPGQPAKPDAVGAPRPPAGTAPAPAAGAGAEKDPVHQFAETLKEKVRSLKRIK